MDKFISVQRRVGDKAEGEGLQWQTLPNCTKLRVWQSSVVETAESEAQVPEQRFLFHISFTPLVEAGNRINYLGQRFNILEVSESRVLTGLELKAERISH